MKIGETATTLLGDILLNVNNTEINSNQYDIPTDWAIVTSGIVRFHDQLWYLTDRKFHDVEQKPSDISKNIKDKYCVIREIPSYLIERQDAPQKERLTVNEFQELIGSL